MATRHFIEYVKSQLATGISKYDLRATLLSSGWREVDIDWVYSAIEHEEDAPAPATPTPVSEKPPIPSLASPIPARSPTRSQEKFYQPPVEREKARSHKYAIMSVVVLVAAFGTFGYRALGIEVPFVDSWTSKVRSNAPSFLDRVFQVRDSGYDSQRKAGLKSIRVALQSYYIDHAQYPTSLVELVPLHMKELPTDPITHQSYEYFPFNSRRAYEVCATLAGGIFYCEEKES